MIRQGQRHSVSRRKKTYLSHLNCHLRLFLPPKLQISRVWAEKLEGGLSSSGGPSYWPVPQETRWQKQWNRVPGKDLRSPCNGRDKAVGPACRKWASREWCLQIQWQSHVCKEPDPRSVSYGLATQTVVRGPAASASPGSCWLEMQNFRPIQAKSTFALQPDTWAVCVHIEVWETLFWVFQMTCWRVLLLLIVWKGLYVTTS